MRLLIGVLALVLGVTTASAIGCGSSGESPAASAGSTSGGDAGCDFGCSACGTCVKKDCATEIAKCDDDPECAVYSQCLFSCSVGSDGNADPTCVAACSTGSSTESKAAAAAITVCRSEGGMGATCTDCHVGAKPLNPDLNQMCTASMDADPCSKCQFSNCCDTSTAYHAEPDAALFADCIGACSGTGITEAKCEYTCEEQHLKGIDVYAPLSACMNFYCAFEQTDCNEALRDSCDRCLYETCGDSYADFVGTQAGFLLHACILTCAVDDTVCDQQCYTTYPTAMDAFSVYTQCLLANCSECES